MNNDNDKYVQQILHKITLIRNHKCHMVGILFFTFSVRPYHRQHVVQHPSDTSKNCIPHIFSSCLAFCGPEASATSVAHNHTGVLDLQVAW